MFSFFKKKPPGPDLSTAPKDFSFLGADMHSHLIPGIDDGSQDIETSLEMIRKLKVLGFSKLITTPHVQLEFFDNTAAKINEHFARLKRFIDDQRLGIVMESAAAEYYLDNFFLPAVFPDGLLSFGDKYVLVEVSMAGWPRQLSDMIFTIQSKGYTPVLAHPERYLFEEDIKVYKEWKSKGVLFQMNLLALTGYYGKGVKSLAELYLTHELYDFCGTDAHHLRHLDKLAVMAQANPEVMYRLKEYPHFRNKSL